MSLRTITLVLDAAGETHPRRLRLLLRWRDLLRLEKDHGLSPEGLARRCQELQHARTILHVALEAGERRAFPDDEVDAIIDEIPLLRLRHFLVRVIFEAFGRLEPGDEEAPGEGPKGTTGSPPAGGSGPSPSPSA